MIPGQAHKGARVSLFKIRLIQMIQWFKPFVDTTQRWPQSCSKKRRNLPLRSIHCGSGPNSFCFN